MSIYLFDKEEPDRDQERHGCAEKEVRAHREPRNTPFLAMSPVSGYGGRRQFRDAREFSAVERKEYSIRHKVARVQTNRLTGGGVRQVLLRKECQSPTCMY